MHAPRRRATTVLLAVALLLAAVGGPVGAIPSDASDVTDANGATEASDASDARPDDGASGGAGPDGADGAGSRADADADGAAAAVAPPTVDVSLVPANVTTLVAPGENLTVEVRVRGAVEGIGSFGFEVRSEDVSVLEIAAAEVAVDAGLEDVTANASSARVSAAAVDVPAGDANGSVTVARLRVRGNATGTAALSLRDVEVGNASGAGDYGVSTTNATVRVEADPTTGPAVVPGSPARDPDGDGTYEDVDGDGRVGVGDVVVLFANLDAPAVLDHPAAFDFGGDGRVGVGDVVALFRLL